MLDEVYPDRTGSHKEYFVCLLAERFDKIVPTIMEPYFDFCDSVLAHGPTGYFNIDRSGVVTPDRVERVEAYIRGHFAGGNFDEKLKDLMTARSGVLCDDGTKNLREMKWLKSNKVDSADAYFAKLRPFIDAKMLHVLELTVAWLEYKKQNTPEEDELVGLPRVGEDFEAAEAGEAAAAAAAPKSPVAAPKSPVAVPKSPVAAPKSPTPVPKQPSFKETPKSPVAAVAAVPKQASFKEAPQSSTSEAAPEGSPKSFMEQVNGIKDGAIESFKALGPFAQSYIYTLPSVGPQIEEVAKSNKIPPSAEGLAVITVIALLFWVLFGVSVLSKIVGFTYPAVLSYNAIKRGAPRAASSNLVYYWIIFSYYHFTESLTGGLFGRWIRFYYWIKIIFLVYCFSPSTQGATLVVTKTMGLLKQVAGKVL